MGAPPSKAPLPYYYYYYTLAPFALSAPIPIVGVCGPPTTQTRETSRR